MFANQRVRPLSWVLSGAYLLLGFMLFWVVQKVAPVYSELQPLLMLPTRVLLWVGPSGWLVLMTFLSALLILRDISFSSQLVRPGITVALWVALSGAIVAAACVVVVAFFQPICIFRDSIR